MSIECDGSGNIAVQTIVDGVNDSLQTEDIGVTVQEDLVSGTNIKTVNGENLLGSGDVVVSPAGRNILLNGEVIRINQRSFNGVSFVDGEYCYDRWKATATKMLQVVEDGNYTPNSTYTLSGDGVTTQQLTSPASGNWTIPEVERSARNIQLELGTEETIFEKRNVSAELAMCKRYFQSSLYGNAPGTICPGISFRATNYDGSNINSIMFETEMRTTPEVKFYNGVTGEADTWRGSDSIDHTIEWYGNPCSMSIYGYAAHDFMQEGHYTAEAEL